MVDDGYQKMIRINLTNGKISVKEIDKKFAREYIGGRGFTAKILYDEVRNVDPLGPDNKVSVASGPLSGLFAPGGGKTHFSAKSPLTGGFGDSNMGGLFSAEMRMAGYDLFVFEGVSKKPVYLYVENDKVEIRDASHLWGKGIITTELEMKKELGEEFQIAAIGPAGEKLVKIACIGHDYGRQAGRAGIGAVMGSKKLKAIAVHGTKDIPVADVKELVKVAGKMFDDCKKHPNFGAWQKYGTSQVVKWASDEIEALPTRNFQQGKFEKALDIDGTTMVPRNVKLNKSCFGCPMACGKYAYIPTYDKYVEGAEYETLALLGSNCGMGFIDDVLMGNYLCDEYGIDTISAGNIIGFTMECSEKGIIKEKYRFGEKEGYLDLIKKIAFREGIGDILAEGVKYAAQKWNAMDLAVHVKGMEQSGYESRAAPSMALSYMTCDVGAHHNRSWAISYDVKEGRDKLEGKAEYVIKLQHIRPLFDQLGACRLQWVELEVDLNDYARLYSAATGYKTTLDELLLSAEKVYNISRAFWFREVKGFGRSWDMPPKRYSEKPKVGQFRDLVIDNDKANKLLDDYYRLRGWDSNGKPTKEKLEKLGLTEVIKDLYPEKVAKTKNN